MPRPSWYQWLVLYAVEEGRVKWENDTWIEYEMDEAESAFSETITRAPRTRKVSMQIRRLAELGLVDDTAEPIAVTIAGLGILRQYSLFEVVEKLQGR